MKHSDFKQAIEKDPEYRAAKEALKAPYTLGDAVLRARLERGWSQSELAKRVGTRQSTISRIEAGLANTKLTLFFKLYQVLDIEIDSLLIKPARRRQDEE